MNIPGATKRRKGNGWAVKAREILSREKEYNPPASDFRCSCKCHDTCHLCGRSFYGSQPHINCMDTGTGGTYIALSD